jgi:hypothetical protein
MKNRETLLRSLVTGDMFSGVSPNGATRIFLVLSITDTMIKARSITTQDLYEFSRQSGAGGSDEDLFFCTIDSVAPLPVKPYNVLLGLDRRYRLGRGISIARLTMDEREAFRFTASYYDCNPV